RPRSALTDLLQQRDDLFAELQEPGLFLTGRVVALQDFLHLAELGSEPDNRGGRAHHGFCPRVNRNERRWIAARGIAALVALELFLILAGAEGDFGRPLVVFLFVS